METVEQPAAEAPAPRAALTPLGPAHVAALLGLTAAAAVALFEAEALLGHAGLALLGGAVAAGFVAGGSRVLRGSGAPFGQALVCAGVLVVPIAAHGAARALGFGRPFAAVPTSVVDLVVGPWFPVQVAMVAAAALALRAFRIPFLVTPIVAAAWLAVQDAAPILFGGAPAWAQRALLSAICGVVILALGVAFDRRERGDAASWLYLQGLVALTGGLVTWTGASTVSLLLVALIHAGLVLASLLLGRRTFAVAGALGLAGAAGRLADDLLTAAAATVAFAAVAFALVGLGLLFHLHRARLAAALRARAPRQLLRLLPPER